MLPELIRRDADGRLAQRVSIEQFPPDAREGGLASIEVTLSDTPGVVTSVEVPDWAKGVRIYPQSQAIRFAVGENPEDVGETTSTTVDEDDWGVGGIAHADEWEVRLLAQEPNRTLRLSSESGGVVVELEAWG